MAKLKMEHVPIDSLHPHPRNVREGDVGAIVTSIEADGFLAPPIVQTETPDGQARNVILAGKHRWLAAQEAGLKTIPIVPVVVTDEEAVRILLNDNRAHDLGRDDRDALAQLLQELGNAGQLDGLLYSGDDIDQLMRDTGLLGDQAASFLDEYIADKPKHEAPDAATVRAEWVQLQFTMLPDDRAAVNEAIKLAQERHEAPTQALGLLAMAKDWLEAERERIEKES